MLAALVAQPRALLHAEAVLLVDDDGAQRLEADVVGQQGVSAHHDVHSPVEQGAHDALALAALDAAGQESHDQFSLAAQHRRVAHLQTRQVGAQGGGVLLGQDLGRGHEGALAAPVDGHQQGRERDHRLARTHVALQEPVHGQRRRHVGADVAEHAALRPGQRETMSAQELAHQRGPGVRQGARRHVEVVGIEGVAHPRRALLEAPAAQRQEELQTQELVEDESAPRRGDLGHVRRDVDAPVGGGPLDQGVVSAQVLVEGIEERPGAFEGFLDEAAHLPTGDAGLARRGIERDDPADAAGVALLARGADDDVDDRVGHLARAAVLAHRTEEDGLHSGDELTGPPGLVEEDHLQGLAVVDHAHLHERASLARAPRGRGRHLGEDGGLVAHLEVREVHPTSAVDVAARIQRDEVEDALEAQ